MPNHMDNNQTHGRQFIGEYQVPELEARYYEVWCKKCERVTVHHIGLKDGAVVDKCDNCGECELVGKADRQVDRS